MFNNSSCGCDNIEHIKGILFEFCWAATHPFAQQYAIGLSTD